MPICAPALEKKRWEICVKIPTNLSSRAFAWAVFEFFYDRKGAIQDLVLLDAVDTDNSSDAAGIVLKTALI